MFGKFLAAAALIFGICASAPAGDIVSLSFNFYGSDGDVVPVGALPEGIKPGPKIKFRNPKLYGYATTFKIDLDKIRSLDLKFTVKGKAGVIKPSVSSSTRNKDGSFKTIECVSFEFCDEPVPNAPCKFSKWTGMSSNTGVEVKDGDTVTLKAEFKPVE